MKRHVNFPDSSVRIRYHDLRYIHCCSSHVDPVITRMDSHNGQDTGGQRGSAQICWRKCCTHTLIVKRCVRYNGFTGLEVCGPGAEITQIDDG